MEPCSWCQGTLDPTTRRCQQCGRYPTVPPLPASAPERESTYLQLGLGRGAGYLDFDLEIGPGQRGVYPLQVLRSPIGVVSGQVHFPFDEPALKQTLLELQNALLRASQPRRRVVSSEDAVVQRFGQSLFEALFTEAVRRHYRLSQEVAAQQGKGLRLRLHLLAPDLAVVPWEYLYSPEQGDYLCLSRTTPLVRYLELPQRPEPLSVSFPLRILGMIASPSDQEALDTAGEQLRVEAALRRLRERGLVELTWLKGQTWRDLQRAMRGGPWHIFHFIGHGGFDPHAEEGVLALANEEGTMHLLRATELARLLATQQALRLVLLNACEGARASAEDRFSSTAAALARRGIPAVVAMQYAITDRAATEWTRAFYEAVADGLPVDAAVAEARTAISLAVPHTLEWGTPVLYLQAPDGVLFTRPEASRPLAASSARTGAEWLAEAQAAHRTGRLQEALAAYDEALRLAPNDPATGRGKAAVLHSLQQATQPTAAQALTTPAPAASGPPSPAPSPLPTRATPLTQQVNPPEPGAASPPILMPSPSPAQSTPPAQSSLSAMGPGAPGFSPPTHSASSEPRAPTPTGVGTSWPSTPSTPRSGKHAPVQRALFVFLILLALVSGSLGIWGLTGHGPLAVLGQHHTSVPTHPAPPASQPPTATPQPAGMITEFSVPTSNSGPDAITAGPDGNLWFTESQANKIGRITPTGKFSEFLLPTSNSFPDAITIGPNGNLWFLESIVGQIGQITPTGKVTEYSIDVLGGTPDAITTGPDGNLWVIGEANNVIGRLNPDGTITQFPVPTINSTPYSITTGPDSNLWFTELDGNKIGRITPAGKTTEFPLPNPNSEPYAISAGPDGALWFTECTGTSSGTGCNNGKIGRITPAGKIIEFSLLDPGSIPFEISSGPDGALWFTECAPDANRTVCNASKIGRITPAGKITEFPQPYSKSDPHVIFAGHAIVAGPDGALWFTEFDGNKIGRITSGK